jgi:hypothetical protein
MIFPLLLLALMAEPPTWAQERVEIGADAAGTSGISQTAGAATPFVGNSVGLAAGLAPTPSFAAAPSLAPTLSFAAAPSLAPAPSLAAGVSPAAAQPFASPSAASRPTAVEPGLFQAAKDLGSGLAASAINGSGAKAGAKAQKNGGAPGAASELTRAADPDAGSRIDGDALFDARRLQADDSSGLIMGGYRLDEATGHLLAPKTNAPITNAEARKLQNELNELRSRRTLLRLSRTTGSDASPERKIALIDINRDAVPREVLKAVKSGPEDAQTTILRRLTSLYRRWLERAPTEIPKKIVPPNAETEEKLGALIAEAAVKHFSEDPEGARLLNELRDKHGKLRLPTMRVLRLDARSGAFYTAWGRQLFLNLDYLKPLLLARLPATRAKVEKSFATEAGALEYLSRHPGSVELLAEAIDVTLFHELVHFHQDLERPLTTSINNNDVPTLVTLEHEYEAWFRQDLYIHSLLSHPGAKLSIDRLDDYLRLLDGFDAWKANIDGIYNTQFFNTYVSLEELARLQDGSQSLIQRLAGPEGRQSAAASERLKRAARGAAAIATDKKAADAELAEYRRRWPQLARDGLRRWVEINEGLGRLPQAALAQERLARLAESPSDAAVWKEKSEQSINRALAKLAFPEGLTLNERIEWINALAAHFARRGEPWKKELWLASFRDYPEKARELRAAAAAASEDSSSRALIAGAEQFESILKQNRVDLRRRAETDLASAFSEADPQRRGIALARGYMEAEVLGDAELIAAFKPLSIDPTEAGWNREAAGAADKALIRLSLSEDLGLDARMAWINAFASYFAKRGEPWKKEMWIASFRDYPEKARALRAEADKALNEPARRALIAGAEQIESVLQQNRVDLRRRAETDLASVFAETDPQRRGAALARGYMEAEVLGDAGLIAAFKPLAQDPTEAGWNREAAAAIDKALIRLAAGADLDLDVKIGWINALAANFNGRRALWKKELWVANLRDFTQKARDLRAEAKKTPDGPGKSALLRDAKGFEDLAASNRAVLRGEAETNLAGARAEPDARRRANLIEWGSMQAEVLGDAALSAAFKSLAASDSVSPKQFRLPPVGRRFPNSP